VYEARARLATRLRERLQRPRWRSAQSRDKLPLVAQASHPELISRRSYHTGNKTGIQQRPGRRQQMINSSLQAFASDVQMAGRISFNDVKRLQRDILPDGISSRAQAELLLPLDQSVSRADRAFADWLVAMMVDFV